MCADWQGYRMPYVFVEVSVYIRVSVKTNYKLKWIVQVHCTVE